MQKISLVLSSNHAIILTEVNVDQGHSRIMEARQSAATTRWDRHKQRIRSRWLVCGERLFRAQGFNTTTVEAIAEAADVMSQVLVLRRGRIVERGTHDALLDKKGLYYTLYTSQFGALSSADAPGCAEASSCAEVV